MFENPILRTPDAIHLATAEYHGAEVFVTGDVGIAVLPPMVRHLLTAFKAHEPEPPPYAIVPLAATSDVAAELLSEVDKMGGRR